MFGLIKGKKRQAAVKHLYAPVALRSKGFVFAAQFITRYAQPYMVAKINAGTDEEHRGFMRRFIDFLGGGAVSIEREDDVKMLQNTADGQAFKPLYERWREGAAYREADGINPIEFVHNGIRFIHYTGNFGKPLDILAASFAADTGGYCWQCSVTLPPDSFARLNMDGRDKGKEAVITVEAAGHTFAFIAEEYGDTRRFGQKDYTVSGRSLTAYLGADYGKPGSGTYQNAVYARQIADAQLEFSGFKVIGWHIPDWLVAGGSYAVTCKTPMAVLQELAKAAGGFVESDPHLPVVRIKPRWPKAAWQIAEAEPDATVPSSVIMQINGRRTVSERCNGVFVWAEHAKGRAGDVYRQGSSREPRAAALTDTLYTDTNVLTAAGMAALSDTGIHKTETVQMPVSEKYGIPLAQLGQVWQIQEPEGHWQGVITGITLTVETENGAPKITQSAVIDRYMDK